MSNKRMLEGFAMYREPDIPPEQCIIGMPLGARCHRIVRLPTGWRVWIATSDYRNGTFLELYEDGSVMHCTARPDEGEELFKVRPSDAIIRSKMKND